jgi:plastocyanin
VWIGRRQRLLSVVVGILILVHRGRRRRLRIRRLEDDLVERDDVKMQMVDDAFQPKTITGKAGSTVKVELKNTGSREHNFKIDGQKADADVEPGEDATVSVKIPTSGSVQFYCEYHKGLGMVGTVKAS